jgi:hypothetical protein
MEPPLDLFDTIAEAIDLRSFSNLWYWIGLAVLWSSVAHFVLGVPYDLMLRARRKGGQAVADMEAMTDICIRRILDIADTAGLWLIGLAACLRGEELYRALFRHRLKCQGIGMVAILVTTMWGMWVNLALSSAFGF